MKDGCRRGLLKSPERPVHAKPFPGMCSRPERKWQEGQAPHPKGTGWFLLRREPCSAFLTFCLLQISLFLFTPSFTYVVGTERKTTLKCCYFLTNALTGVTPVWCVLVGFFVFFTNAWCRTGLEMGLKMMRALSTLSKCLWHLLFCGATFPESVGRWRGTALLLQ